MEKTSVALGRRTSGTTGYSYFCWFSRMGSAVCGNRLMMGVAASWKVSGLTPSSRRWRRSSPSTCETRKISSARSLNPAFQTSSTREIEKEELLGEGEIFLEQTIAEKGASRVGQHALIFSEAHRPQARRGEGYGLRTGVGRIANDDAGQPGVQRFVEGVNQRTLACQVKPQAVHPDSRKLGVARGAQLEPQGALGISRLEGGLETVGRFPLGGGDGERPQRGVVSRAENTRDAAYRPGIEDGIARNGQSG